MDDVYVLVKKIFTNGLNMNLPQWTIELNHTDSQWSVKKVMLSLLENERTYNYWFPWKKFNCK